MKRHLSTLALSALAVAAVGGLTILRTGLVAEAAWRHDYTPLTVNTYPVSGSFTDISVTDYYADVQFRVSRDGSVSVVTRDAADVTHNVRVEGDTLTITRPEPSVGQRLFHHEDDDPEVTVYLPAGSYGALTVSNTSGDIESAAQLGFASANLTTVSGDIDLNGSVGGTTVSGDIDLNGSVGGKVVCNTTSGDVELRSPTIGDVEINTTSGDVELNDSYIQSLKVVSVSGDASLERVTAAGAVTIETTSGDVELEGSDAASLTISTTSGEVEGSLLTSKNFAVSSSIGRVSVPTSDPAGAPCTVTTTSGDIRLIVRP